MLPGRIRKVFRQKLLEKVSQAPWVREERLVGNNNQNKEGDFNKSPFLWWRLDIYCLGTERAVESLAPFSFVWTMFLQYHHQGGVAGKYRAGLELLKIEFIKKLTSLISEDHQIF